MGTDCCIPGQMTVAPNLGAAIRRIKRSSLLDWASRKATASARAFSEEIIACVHGNYKLSVVERSSARWASSSCWAMEVFPRRPRRPFLFKSES